MKSIRKIGGKVTALAVAIATSVALLSPYDANASSGGEGPGGGGGRKCYGNFVASVHCGYIVSLDLKTVAPCYVTERYCPTGTNISQCTPLTCNNMCGTTSGATMNCN